MTDMANALTEEISNWEKVGHPALMQRFVLRNGRQYDERAPKPDKLWAPNECFRNAALWVQMHGGKYVEGYVHRANIPLLFLHAWAVDKDNQVIELTFPDNSDCSYFGVPFSRKTAWREIMRNKVYGLLDTGLGVNLKFILAHDPELTGIVEKIAPQLKLA